MLKLRTLVLIAQFSRVTKNQRLFEKKISYLILFFQNLKILTKLLILAFFIQMSDSPSINALFKFFLKILSSLVIFCKLFFALLSLFRIRLYSFQLLVFSPIWSIPKFWPKIFKFDVFQQKGVWGGLSGY